MSEIVIIIRPSFMKFCKDGCRAALFNHILYWIARKAKGRTDEEIQSTKITWYATTDELVEQMAGAWGREKIRIETNNLVDMGLIGRSKNPKYGADRTKHFFFGEEQYKKLLELCLEHKICLACIDLPDDVEHFLKTVKQNPNSGNAKPESGICFSCPKHEQNPNPGLAKPESGQALTKISTKTVKTKITERKNDASQQNPNILSQEDSSIHPSTQSTFSVEFDKDEQLVYDLAEKKHVSHLKKNKQHKEYCAKIASEGVRTLEQIDSLMQFCWQKSHLTGKDLYLKNLVNELNGWQQVQQSQQSSRTISSYDDENYVDDTFYDPKVTDDELAEEVRETSRLYRDIENFEVHWQSIKSIKNDTKLSNYDLYDKIINARGRAPFRQCSIDDFFYELRCMVT